jgi:hypothetical protein
MRDDEGPGKKAGTERLEEGRQEGPARRLARKRLAMHVYVHVQVRRFSI